ncbi:MAG: hypothetical protein JXR84_27410 [Anaerolineae bacterium]|nr:hypothetical protein [Anaerolineae bacterium]
MAGTFRHGDLLLVVPVVLSQLRIGDVVVFCRTSADRGAHTTVVHRVTACVEDGVITQGDALALPDATIVHPTQLLGRVTQVQRGDKCYAVWSGFAGQVWRHYVRLRHHLLALGRAPYQWLRASGLVRRLWRPSFTHMTLSTEQGPVVKYLCGGKTVAVWQPKTQAYWCRKPYDLVLGVPEPTTNVIMDDI